MSKLPNEFYIVLVQYNEEEIFQLRHVCDNILDAIYYKKYCQKKAIENNLKEFYKICRYVLDNKEIQ